MSTSRTLSGTAALALAGLLASPSSALAFNSDNHHALTSAAFRGLADPNTVDKLRGVSLKGDEEAWEVSGAHFDNCAWNEGSLWIRNYRTAAVSAAIIYDLNPTPDNRDSVFDNFGFVLHATEDFYAHSNWVETHNWGELADLDGSKPANWISGTFPDDEPKRCAEPSQAHAQLNKDDAGRDGFEEAYADAILAVQDQLDRFVAELRSAAPSRADAILAELGLRKQRRVITEALAWPTGKVYFFQENQYSRYDLIIDHVDPGYSLATVDYWPGLDAFGGYVHGAFVAPNRTDAYFFNNGRYVRYDIAADEVAAGYPRNISPDWQGLWSTGVDAAVLWPNGKVYFFRGGQYDRYDLGNNQVDAGYPKSIAGMWHGLEPFSRGIDAVFVRPDGQKAYFFRGDYYIRYDIAADRADPGYPLRIEDYWHGL